MPKGTNVTLSLAKVPLGGRWIRRWIFLWITLWISPRIFSLPTSTQVRRISRPVVHFVPLRAARKMFHVKRNRRCSGVKHTTVKGKRKIA